MIKSTALLSVATCTKLAESYDPCCGGDVINKPCCTDDSMINNCSFQGGEKYCDAGCQEELINDADCNSNTRKFTDTSKCTNIVRDNRRVGPNVVKRYNDVNKNLARDINISRGCD